MNNKYRFILPNEDAKYINIPLEIKWDFYGRDDSIDIYEEEVIEEIIGSPVDFEILRFTHKNYLLPIKNSNKEPVTATMLQQQFNFFSGNSSNMNSAAISDWTSSYRFQSRGGFTVEQLYFYEKPFTKSFFKLDFYDSNTAATQTNYFTVILPVQQGLTESVIISKYKPNVDVKIPTMNLDYIGDKEGFYIYWLRKRDFINLNTFYVSAKFFDARIGEFIRMINVPQTTTTLLPSIYNFDSSIYFYYKVVLDYNTKTYEYFDVKDINNKNRLGVNKPIKWYEYVNPK